VGEPGPMKGIPQSRPSKCWIISELALYVRSITLSGVRATVAPMGVADGVLLEKESKYDLSRMHGT
jgi:hypothetical protein